MGTVGGPAPSSRKWLLHWGSLEANTSHSHSAASAALTAGHAASSLPLPTVEPSTAGPLRLPSSCSPAWHASPRAPWCCPPSAQVRAGNEAHSAGDEAHSAVPFCLGCCAPDAHIGLGAELDDGSLIMPDHPRSIPPCPPVSSSLHLSHRGPHQPGRGAGRWQPHHRAAPDQPPHR